MLFLNGYLEQGDYLTVQFCCHSYWSIAFYLFESSDKISEIITQTVWKDRMCGMCGQTGWTQMSDANKCCTGSDNQLVSMCMFSRQGQVDGWSLVKAREGDGMASVLILYLSSLSTESSAVPSSHKLKYYYLCPLSIITPPLSVTRHTLKLTSWSLLSVYSSDRPPLPNPTN